MLKTGIVASANQSNVRSSTTFASEKLVRSHRNPTTLSSSTKMILDASVQRLKEHCLSQAPCQPNPDNASVAVMGGFIIRVASENIPCASCVALLQGPKASTPLLGLIAHQDRGGLFYPSYELVKILVGLKKFVDSILPHRKCLTKPLEVCVEKSVEILMGLPILSFENTDSDHRKRLLVLITKKFMKPLLTNYMLGTTDRIAVVKMLQQKPLSRKVLKL